MRIHFKDQSINDLKDQFRNDINNSEIKSNKSSASSREIKVFCKNAKSSVIFDTFFTWPSTKSYIHELFYIVSVFILILQDAELCQGKAAHSVSIGNGRVATSTIQDEVNTLA